ncbi:MAG: VTT domain-containing protein [Kiritimatiellae bacterium]|nr:VTT domain-containing protein [Kiritimatiellia bacterium]
MNGPAGNSARGGDRRAVWLKLAGFMLISLLLAGVGLFTPLRHMLALDALRTQAARAGWWGPAIVLVLGALSPLLFMPRWPVACVCGLLYGVCWGSLLANSAALAGAWLQFRLARGTLSHAAERWLPRQGRWRALLEDPHRVFLGLFVLRAFPLSNFVATNLLAGTLRLPSGTYLAASFFGMIPSTIMYAAWGKLVREPNPAFHLVIAGMLALLVVSAWLMRRLTK